jgi:flagellar basal body-associated protein FliL
MSLLVVIITLVLLAAVIAVISAPLRATRRSESATAASATTPPPPAPDQVAEIERDELEAAREAKYREIRDAELDYRTGKLSREDYEAIDGALRAEAIEILNRLERLDA